MKLKSIDAYSIKNIMNIYRIAKYRESLHFVLLVIIMSSMIEIHPGFAATTQQKIDALLKTAEKYSENMNNSPLVLKMCDNAVKLQPQNIETYYKCGMILGRMGDYINAIKYFSIVIKSDDKKEKWQYPTARKFRADCYVGLGVYQKAAEEYSYLLKRAPGSGKIWFYYSESLALMNENALALKAIQNGCATGSHWCGKMRSLQKKILMGEKIIPHAPLSN